eukprot:Rhum_TRINITY_DN14595_c1_g3::Rhum_TRINITY_DN14595_c1_g3_i1::g.99172::m.99172/K13051/iaaA, ASRGL1; beta-aspartyl-peptidase (threonine type)
MPWCIAVHVGVGQAASEARADNLKALMHRALRAGRTALEAAITTTSSSSSSTDVVLLDACCAAVSALESSGLVNAGCGSNANEDGIREADACVVTGAGAVGCVAATRGVDGNGGNGPVAQAACLARAGIDDPAEPAVVAGSGGGAPASAGAVDAEDGGACDTVGAVAFRDGRAAAAVSSGGPVGKRR